jgi:hypothetical protein
VSSDNFYLVRRAGERYAVSMEFASSVPDHDPRSALDDAVARFYYPTPIDSPNLVWFDSAPAALDYAHGEYSEYGVDTDTSADSAGDTRMSRLIALLGAITPFAEGIGQVNDHENSAVTLQRGSFQVKVTADSFDEASAIAGWFDAVLTMFSGE